VIGSGGVVSSTVRWARESRRPDREDASFMRASVFEESP
jgi:hypothetical protein